MDLLNIISNFKNLKILVVGDVMLDTYLNGIVKRVNPEAPVPVVEIDSEENLLGGAANVASNLKSLGAEPFLWGFIGNDSAGKKIKSLLIEKKIDFHLEEKSITTHKTRLTSNNHHISRFDREDVSPKFFSDIQKLYDTLNKVDGVIVSDYAKGTITQELMEILKSKKVFVDPKPKNLNLYKGVFLIKPNKKEILEMTQSDVEIGAKKLKEFTNANIITTLGKDGMFVYGEKGLYLPTFTKEVYDVVGAGDTACATITLSILSGANLEEAAILANYACSIAIGKTKTSEVYATELASLLSGSINKILDEDLLKQKIKDLKKKGKKIVWTNGCFDILHAGHIDYLKKAKQKGDILVVGLNSDSSVKSLKGPSRPINPENERAEIISSLEFVDFVTIFNDLDVSRILSKLQPDIFIKGGDYTLSSLNQLERFTIESYGGKIDFIPFKYQKSTSKIIEDLKS